LEWDQSRIQSIAGIDCSYDPAAKRVGAVVVVCKTPSFQVVEVTTDIQPDVIPYIPGYLHFRKAPACLKAFRKLTHPPDITLLDGNGIAHPRKMGLAAYFGVLLDISTIGCAKNPLFSHSAPKGEKGSFTTFSNDDGVSVGVCIRTRENIKPVFISPGHRIDIAHSKKIILSCSRTRIPEPLRLAHLEASRIFLNPDRI